MTSPQDDRVRERAHAIWEAEGRPDNRAVEHWLQAEREVGTDPVDGPVAAGKGAPGPDETVETSGDASSWLVPPTERATESVEADG